MHYSYFKMGYNIYYLKFDNKLAYELRIQKTM